MVNFYIENSSACVYICASVGANASTCVFKDRAWTPYLVPVQVYGTVTKPDIFQKKEKGKVEKSIRIWLHEEVTGGVKYPHSPFSNCPCLGKHRGVLSMS